MKFFVMEYSLLEEITLSLLLYLRSNLSQYGLDVGYLDLKFLQY